MPIAPIQDIVAELHAGRMVVLVDEEDRENEGDLVFAADFVTAEAINFMAQHGRGLICLPLTDERAPSASISRRWSPQNRSVHGTNFTVSIEAAQGVTTGISAADRAHTVRVAVARRRQARRHRAAGPHLSARWRSPAACWRAPATPKRAAISRALAGLTPAAVHLRDHERRRHDGAPARSRSCSRASTASRSARSPT